MEIHTKSMAFHMKSTGNMDPSFLPSEFIILDFTVQPTGATFPE